MESVIWSIQTTFYHIEMVKDTTTPSDSAYPNTPHPLISYDEFDSSGNVGVEEFRLKILNCFWFWFWFFWKTQSDFGKSNITYQENFDIESGWKFFTL